MSPLIARLEVRAGTRYWPQLARLLAGGQLVVAADVPAPMCVCLPRPLPVEVEAKTGAVRCLLCGRSVEGYRDVARWDWWRHPVRRMASARTSS